MITFKHFLNEAEELTSRDEVIKFLESKCAEYSPYVNAYLKEVEKFKKLVVSLDIKPSFFNIGLFSEYHDIVKKGWVRPCFYIPNGAGTPNQLLWEVFKPALEKIKGARLVKSKTRLFDYFVSFPTNPKNELQLDKILNPEALEFLSKKEIFFYSHVNFYIEVLKTLTDFVKNCEKNLLKKKESYKIAGGWWRAGSEYENYCFNISGNALHVVINPSGRDKHECFAHFRNGDTEVTADVKGDGEEFFNLLIGYYGDKYDIKVFPEEDLYPTRDEFFK